ncbi:MAG TPA: DNA internalization-related competence protein ComEC/Rec2 [Polyangiaceae bacterium]|nr:DNA internalization-related competence protein ComEC/Rec2 [Polyangiaceae bacterium]
MRVESARGVHCTLAVRVDVVMLVAVAAALGGLFGAAPLAVVGFVAIAVVLLSGHVRPALLAVAVVALGLSAVRAASAVRSFEARLFDVRARIGAPRRCSGTGTVTTSPTSRAGVMAYVVDFDDLECEGRALGAARVRLYEGPRELARGDAVEIVAQLAPAELFRNAELPDPTFNAARAGVTLSGAALSARVVRTSYALPALIDRQRTRARDQIEATFAPLAAPLARALVLGENDLSDDDGAAFRASGLSHLLAVSGTHLVFAVLGIVHALAFVLVRIEPLAVRRDVGRIAAGVGAVLAPLYADFAGGSGSAWRAAWMLTVGLGARALGRHPSALRSFALSTAVGVFFDPLVAFDVSFALSAAATAGLLCIGQPLSALVAPEGSGVLRRAVTLSTLATVSAMVPCTPLLATLGAQLTLAGVIANVVAVPFGETVSLPLCLVHAVVPGRALARGIALVASGALLVVRWLARTSAAATWLAVPVPPPGAAHFVVLGVGGLGLLLAGPGVYRVARRAGFVAGTLLGLLVVELAARRAGAPQGVLRMTVLDVGQGDSALVDLPDGKLVLVDGGGFVGSPVDPGRSVVLPVLRARRRSRIDVAVLTHPHPDHFLGLATVLHAVDVGELWDTGQGREQGAGPVYAAMIADLSRRKIPLRSPAELCGPERSLGGARLSVFAPCPSFEPALGANDNSFVVRLRFGERALLLTGDAEGLEEEKLLPLGDALRADVLKVAHHGSRTSSSPALVDAIAPRFATVSCGVRNRFGHPFPGTLSVLEAARARVLRTDVSGSIEFVTDGASLGARVFGDDFAARFGAALW